MLGLSAVDAMLLFATPEIVGKHAIDACKTKQCSAADALIFAENAGPGTASHVSASASS